jgi:hypothetical protein
MSRTAKRYPVKAETTLRDTVKHIRSDKPGDCKGQRQPFLMGARPGASDFAVYAQLTHFDPTPARLAARAGDFRGDWLRAFARLISRMVPKAPV